MYITSFPVNRTRRETRRMLSSPYGLHAAIAASFPYGASQADEEGRVLWRLDYERSGAITLYIVSPEPPSLVGLDEQIGWPDLSPKWKTRDYGPFLECIEEGQRYRFRLAANPVINRRSVSDRNGRSKRLPHKTTLQQLSWLVGKRAYEDAGVIVHDEPICIEYQQQSRAVRNGFEVIYDDSGFLRAAVTDSRTIDIRKELTGDSIPLRVVRYEGVLSVLDAEKLRTALTHGIGKAKGFGCGLLTLSRYEDM